MNKDIEQKARALNEWILNQEVVKEFKKYESLMKEHKELLDLEEELKVLQKRIVNDKYQGINSSDIIKEYENKKNYFDNHPIVSNYLTLKQEVNELLLQIQEDINEQLKKKVD